LVRWRWGSRGWRIGKRTIITAQAGSTETIKRGRRARKEACRNDSEERNRIVDTETDGNIDTQSEAHDKSRAKAEGNAKAKSETNSQKNRGGKSFSEAIAEGEAESDEID